MSCSPASWSIVADGVISDLGGRKIASGCGAHQEGKVPPRAAQTRSLRGVIRRAAAQSYMSQLADLFRDAKFVHLYRDGRECAYSFSRHPAYRLGAVSAMLDSRLGMSPYLDDAKPPEQVPPDLRPFMPETFDHEAFVRFEVSVAESGQFWSDMIIPALDVLASLPAERVLQVSYENLVAEPRQALSHATALPPSGRREDLCSGSCWRGVPAAGLRPERSGFHTGRVHQEARNIRKYAAAPIPG
jgi:hypothetical protein